MPCGGASPGLWVDPAVGPSPSRRDQIMNLLILYGTTEGQTRKIAEHAADRLYATGHQGALHNTSDREREIDLDDYDGVIVGAPVYDDSYPSAVEEFVRAHNRKLNGASTMFLSVSLAAASGDAQDIQNMRACVDRFLTQTEWRPDEIHHVMGALKAAQTEFFRWWALKFLCTHAGLPQMPGRDHEFTDWIALSRLVDGFVTKLGASAVARRNVAETIKARQTRAIGRLERDETLRPERGKRPAHGFHR